jgi:peptidoglycan hydrolase-like protein with peptidoglycan-binding domain
MNKLLNSGTRLGIFMALAAGGVVLPVARAATKQNGTAHKSARATTASKSAATAKTATSSNRAAKTTRTKKGAARKSKRLKGQGAPTPERIHEIQNALAKKGFYAGEPSGKWDDDSTEAIKKFQAANGLAPSGKYDAWTLQKLGLGSETAGLGAPAAPPNTANRLLSSKAQRDELKNEDQPE